MKALVTGATGIVGSNLVRALLAAAFDVRVLVRPSSDRRSLQGLAVECCQGDVLEPTSLGRAMSGRELVFHAAAVFSYWSREPDAQQALAVRGTRHVLEAAARAGVHRVVLTSSSVVLGSTPTAQVLDEDCAMPSTGESAYTQSKVAQEALAFDLARRLGLALVAVCPTLVVGAHDYRLSPSNANIVNYLNDPFRSTFLGGCNIVAARDVAEGHVLAALHGQDGSRYVLGSENLAWPELHGLVSDLSGSFGPSLKLNHTAAYLAAAASEVAARLSGTAPAVTRDEAKMSGRFYWYSHAHATEQLGYRPMSARLALAEAIAWLIARSQIGDSVLEQLMLAPEVLAAGHRFRRKGTAWQTS